MRRVGWLDYFGFGGHIGLLIDESFNLIPFHMDNITEEFEKKTVVWLILLWLMILAPFAVLN